MAEDAARNRVQQHIEDLCLASIRALSGDVRLTFRSHRLHRGRTPLPLPAAHLHPDIERDTFRSFRGASDGMALRLLHSDACLHAHLRPEETTRRLVFDLLEQFRVESLVSGYPGVVANLRGRHEDFSLQFHRSGLTETHLGLLLYTVTQMVRSRLTGEPVVAETEDLIEQVRGELAATLGHELAGLRRNRNRQRAFAAHSLAIADKIAAAIDSVREEGDDDGKTRDRREVRAAFSLLLDDDDGGELARPAPVGSSEVLTDSGGGYRIFTSRYDKELAAASLVRPALLRELRLKLDEDIAGAQLNSARLSRQLEALLCQPSASGWHSGQEEGLIDGSRLSQLITSPAERRLFKTERAEPVSPAVVGFLIDCSGSMKQHARGVAVLVDVFARALERIDVDCEVLGFTTGAWNGGRALRDWRRAGRPAHPGRLNELNHLIFKDTATPWRRARLPLAALLKPDLYRESVDGEAVRWAAGRLASQPRERRILMVISDGSPADGATGLANDEQYLAQHLRQVTGHLEESGSTELYGLGLGLDLSPYYSRSKILDLTTLGGRASIGDVVSLLGGRGG